MPQANIAIVTFSSVAENEYTCSLFERMPGRTRNETALSYHEQKTKTFFFDASETDYAVYLRRPDSIGNVIGRVAPYVIVHVSCHDDAAIWKEAVKFIINLKKRSQTQIAARKVLDVMMVATLDADPTKYTLESTHNIAKMQVITLALISGHKPDSTLADVGLTTTMFSRVLRFLAPEACRVYRCGKCKKFITFAKPIFQPCAFESLDETSYECRTIIKAPPIPAYLPMEVRSLAYHNITPTISESDKPCRAPKSMLKRFRYVNRKNALEFARREGLEDCFFYFGPPSKDGHSDKREIKRIFQERIAPKCEARHKEILRKIQERRRKLSKNEKEKGKNCAIS